MHKLSETDLMEMHGALKMAYDQLRGSKSALLDARKFDERLAIQSSLAFVYLEVGRALEILAPILEDR